MKVCFIVGTLGRGGAERQLVYMLRALRLEGIDVRVLCLTSGEAFESEIRELGVDVVFVGSSRNRLAKLSKIVRETREYAPDLVQSSHFYTNIYAAIAGRLSGIPSIGAIRNDLLSEIRLDRVFGRSQIRLPDFLIANSSVAVRRAEMYRKKTGAVGLVRNVVDLNGTGQPGAKPGTDGVAVLFAGRLVDQKRPDWFVSLAGRLHHENGSSNVRFRMIGGGPLRTSLDRQREDLGLTNAVFSIAGETADMESEYRQSDLLVLTSSFEGTPNVVLEAMSCGLPVVATKVGGVSEIVTEETGIPVEPSDFEGLVAATRGLIEDRGRRIQLGERARAFVREHHSLGYLRQRLPEIYAEQLSAKSTNN